MKSYHALLIALFYLIGFVSFVTSNYCNQTYDANTCTYIVQCKNMLRLQSDWSDFHFSNGMAESADCKPVIPNYQDVEMKSIYLKYEETIISQDFVPECNDNVFLDLIKVLDLSKNRYYNIPKLYSMINLEKLILSNNDIESIQLPSFDKLPVLKDIDYSHNKIKDADYSELSIRYLKTINLSYNELTRIPIFASMRDLEDLDVSHNNIDFLGPISFEGFKELKNINLAYNRITDINSSLFRFINLESLNLEYNLIQHIDPNDFEKLSNLRTLNIGSNVISELGQFVFNDLSALKTLVVSNNNIIIIDKDMFKNNSLLQIVDISKNKIKTLPKGLFKGKNMLLFSIEENEIEGPLTRGMFDGLTYVSELDLSYQNIDFIDDYAFSGLTKLEILLLNNNDIKNVTSKCFITLSKLKTLDLSHNKISHIAFDESDFYYLETLSLKNNFLIQITQETFKGMRSLQYLELSNNRITHVEPNSFESLKDLIDFKISNNPLNGVLLNGTFEGLNSLPNLDISSTLLTVIENNSFIGMLQLKDLNISQSQINTLQFNAFNLTGSIQSIDLSFNLLTEFNVNTTQLLYLRFLYLNNNLIKSLSPVSFQKLSLLSTVILSHNELEEISPVTFSNINSLQTIDFSYNEKFNFNSSIINAITTLDALSLSGIKKRISLNNIELPISKLVISNASIYDIKVLKLNKLTELNAITLSHNNISKLNYFDFSNLSNLRSLDLSYNLISFIQPGTFKDNTLLRSLNISHNLLTVLSYGIFRGLINLNVIDVSYNNIKDLRNERFYEVSRLEYLIVDHNKIETININEFIGTSLVSLSLGNNPIPCDILVNFKRTEADFAVTALNLDDKNDENIDGIICNNKGKNYYAKTIKNSNENNFSSSKDVESILLNIRDILIENTKNFNTENVNDNNYDKYFTNLSDQVDKVLKSNENANSKFVNLTTENVGKSEKTNLLLERILRVLSTKTTTAPPLTKDNATYENLVQYINKVKQDMNDEILFEKGNIISELENEIAKLKSNLSMLSLVANKPEYQEQKAIVSDKSIFTEACVAIILIILVGIVLYIVYKSGIFVRKSFSISTRELPRAMDSSL